MSQVFVAVAVILVTATSAVAQPLGSLKILVPANPGGGWDQTRRAMEQALRAENLVTGPIRITNKGGLADFARAKGEKESLMVMALVMVGAILTNKSAVNLDAVTPITRLTSEYLVTAVPAASKIQTLQGPTEYFYLMVLAFTTVR
jgi:putative tricarboxylic transport membrane protein